ncbi:MAG: FAD-dependent oxidoreductase [Paracoccaceae bacterium]|nr:FAD-dependent oxidoreductase [Paracoccaceae bacterium]
MPAECLVCDVAVVGAGPAGLAASQAAAEAGVKVICVDQFSRAGGQYHMQPNAPDTPFAKTGQVRQGQQAICACEAINVRFMTGAEVFWAEPPKSAGEPFRLHIQRDDLAIVVEATTVVAACGAMERPMPFPGWTLPGVIGAGAAQRLLKTSGKACALPFDGKTVLAGTGPFLLAVASTFAKAGQKVDHFVEMQPAAPLKKARAMLRHPSRLPDAVALLRDLSLTGAKRHMGAIVTRAMGQDKVASVEVAPLGVDAAPDLSRSFLIEGIGALCIGYGFQPMIDLTTALGATHSYDLRLGGWHCRTDALSGASSLPGLYAAGEVTGLGGANPARLSGQLAGQHAAAASRGETPERNHNSTRLATQLYRFRAFAATLAQLYPMPERFPVPLVGDEVVCRCEDVTLSDIKDAIAEGAHENFAVKMWTRAGMGLCQGRNCGAGIAAALAEAGIEPRNACYNRSHFPLRPVSMRIAKAALASSPEPKA